MTRLVSNKKSITILPWQICLFSQYYASKAGSDAILRGHDYEGERDNSLKDKFRYRGTVAKHAQQFQTSLMFDAFKYSPKF